MKTLKKLVILLVVAAAISITTNNDVQAQDVEVSTGADFVSTYVWRGSAIAGPSIQPYVELGAGGFTVGAWGSQSYSGFQEMDLYAGYTFDFGLYLGLTDYYYPPSQWFSFSEDPANGDFSSHALEINAGYELDDLTLSANFIVNESTNAGSAGNDLYFEVSYSTSVADVFVGAGNGWHTNGTTDFGLVNIGVTSSKEIIVTDTFSIPVFGSAVFNPYAETLYILAGISL